MERDAYTNLYLEAIQYKEDFLKGYISKNKFSTLLTSLSDEIINNYDNEVLERSDCNELLKIINSCKDLLRRVSKKWGEMAL